MNRSVDARSDLYALGVTLYQMLTGCLPFTAADPLEWVHCHVARRPVPPAERCHNVPALVSAIVMKLLTKAADERYQTAGGLEHDLHCCLAQWEAEGRIGDFPLGDHDTADRLLMPEKTVRALARDESLLAPSNASSRAAGRNSCGLGVRDRQVFPRQRAGQGLVPPRGLFAGGKFDQYMPTFLMHLAHALQVWSAHSRQERREFARWRDACRGVSPNGH